MGRDKPVASLSRADCVAVLTFLKRLPPNATKRFPNLSLTEIADSRYWGDTNPGALQPVAMKATSLRLGQSQALDIKMHKV